MQIGADRERQILNHYHIASLYPERWPLQDNESSDDEEEARPNGAAPTRQISTLSMNSRSSYSKYKNIDRHASVRSAATDSESLVQQDEPDALGMAPSVATQLKRRGIPVDQSDKLRNRFMLSSTSFNPASFLATVHQDASLDDLLRGLDYLSQSIEQKSASLKVLVESNFEKFVKAKATIDNVYIEMRTQGGEAETLQQQEPRSTRRLSKNQSHFRTSSGRHSSGMSKPLAETEKRKNALTKESEYGVLGIKAPLTEVAIRSEEVWGPAFGGKDKEETLTSAVSSLEQYRDIFELGGNLRESVRKNDYDNIVDAYKRAQKHANTARNMADIAKARDGGLSDANAQQIIVTAKMWHDVDGQIIQYKRDVAKRLRDSHERRSSAVSDETDKEEHMQLIGVLIQLGVDESPIPNWLHGRGVYLKDKIARTFERSRIEIEVQRCRLARNTKADGQTLATYLQSIANVNALRPSRDANKDIDAPAIVAFWEKVYSSVAALLSVDSGILGEVAEYWETLQSFIDNKAQKVFSHAVIAAGQDQLELKPDEVQRLRAEALDLITNIRENLLSFFSDPPVDDIRDLYSPIPPTPRTPESNAALTPSLKKSFTFDLNNIPPPSPKRGDPWEKFAFWAPQANSLSGSLYLNRILGLVGVGASEMAALSVVKQSRGEDALKLFVATVRERCVQAVCSAWASDAEHCKNLETWVRHPDRRDLTRMPSYFSAFEEKVLQNTQKIAYISEARSARGGAEIIAPPSAKLLQALRGTFVTNLYKALSGMVENAENPKKNVLGGADPDGVTVSKSAAVDGGGVSVALDSDNRVRNVGFLEWVFSLTLPQNIRILLTLSNLAHLRIEIIPQLISQFETNFSVKLTDESKTIRDILGQIDARLFQSYVGPTVEQLKQLISEGIASPDWEPTVPRPTDARPYVNNVLLKLVLVHSEITATATTLTNQVLSHMLEQSSQALLEAFKKRPKYTLAALIQATLDVEFIAQTLNNYTTDKAGEIQSQIYSALDERTDNDARARLQGELPGMRTVLKKLRESTKGEFGCFKKERRGRSGDKPSNDRSVTSKIETSTSASAV